MLNDILATTYRIYLICGAKVRVREVCCSLFRCKDLKMYEIGKKMRIGICENTLLSRWATKLLHGNLGFACYWRMVKYRWQRSVFLCQNFTEFFCRKKVELNALFVYKSFVSQSNKFKYSYEWLVYRWAYFWSHIKKVRSSFISILDKMENSMLNHFYSGS